MTSKVQYLKGIRTRYVNTLQKETKLGQDLIPISGDVSDEIEFMIRCNSSIERLQLYHEKVENQTEKLAEALGNSEKELNKQIVSENEVICDQAMECVTHLKMFKEKVSAKNVKKIEAKENHGLDQIVELQKQMNVIVTNQMKQQSELLEKQELNEKE